MARISDARSVVEIEKGGDELRTSLAGHPGAVAWLRATERDDIAEIARKPYRESAAWTRSSGGASFNPPGHADSGQPSQ